MNARDTGTTPYTFRNAMASAPAAPQDHKRVAMQSLTSGSSKQPDEEGVLLPVDDVGEGR